MAFDSPFPDVDIPDVSVFDLLFTDIAPADPDRIALIDVPSAARRRVEFIDTIPKSAAGKILRKELPSRNAQ